jgi:TetR/AcrR family transcriptional repressor of nem operon
METMLDLIWTASYGSISVDDICKAAGAQKGIFYHFFASKAELAMATFEQEWAECRTELDEIFSASRAPLQRFVKFFDVIYKEQQEKQKEFGYVVGCPFCTIGSELATQDESLRERIDEVFTQHLRYFENAIRDAIAQGDLSKKTDVEAKAREIDSFITGAFTTARIKNSLEPMGKDLVKGVFSCLDVAVPGKKAA